MASSNSPLLSSPSSTKDLQQWVNHISKTFETHILIDTCLPLPCIFLLPQTLTSQKPESYLPQHIGLGPIHHFRTDLYSEQQQLKLITAKTVLSPFKITSEFEKVILETVKTLVPKARWCYNLSFNMDDDTLAWVFALDGLFLLHVLSKAQGDSLEYFEDVMMLENQIPLLVLLKLQHALKELPTRNPDNSFPSSSTSKYVNLGIISQAYLDEIPVFLADGLDTARLISISLQFVKFCETRSPIKYYPWRHTRLYLDVDMILVDHLLDCMYHMIVKYEPPVEDGGIDSPVGMALY